MKTPKFSVVTVSYNQCRFLKQTLDSVLSQTYPEVEYIVIDGGSTDGSADLIRAYAERLDYWVSEPDRGQSHALNKGFEQATGDIFCWINSDDYFLPSAFEKVASFFSTGDEPAWAIGGCQMVDALGQETGRRNGLHASLERTISWGSKNWFPQQATFWTRKMWELAGPLDEDNHFTMDLALWLRMFRFAQPQRFADLVAGYRFHDEAKGDAKRSETLQEMLDLRLSYYLRFFRDSVDAGVIYDSQSRDIQLLTQLG
jgi:glycosyltransferase involved in cell wall biosynthesis